MESKDSLPYHKSLPLDPVKPLESKPLSQAISIRSILLFPPIYDEVSQVISSL